MPSTAGGGSPAARDQRSRNGKKWGEHVPRQHVNGGFDGTTGRSNHGGRRTHVIQLLRDSKTPVSVKDVAEEVGVHQNTARFHLESLVDSGLAERTQQTRTTPGRPKVLYRGTLPNQTHERAQAYRLLAEALTTAVADNVPDAGAVTYAVGRTWGRDLTEPPEPDEAIDEHEVSARLVSKLDALWFAPTLGGEPSAQVASPGGAGMDALVLNNCPFVATARCTPQVVCSLHAGFINGALAELGSSRRATALVPQFGEHHCVARLETVDVGRHDEAAQIPILVAGRAAPA
ncbi:putative ArsR family transcriptional regulator [Oerskovia enterophila]